jgi:hypothetical protein
MIEVGDCLLSIASVEIIERPLLAPLDIFVARHISYQRPIADHLMPFSLVDEPYGSSMGTSRRIGFSHVHCLYVEAGKPHSVEK